VWLPFPTEIIGGQGTADAVGRAVYIGSVLASSTMLLVLEIVIKRTPALWVDREHTDIDLLDAIATVIALVAALAIAVAVPVIGMWSMLLLATTPWISGPLRRRRDRAAATA